MELSDDDEEIVDLNDEKPNDGKNLEKSKLRTSSKNIKWVKSSLESISQIAKGDIEDIEYEETHNIYQNEEINDINNDNINNEENQENLSDYNNDANIENNNDNYNKENNNNDFTEKTEETRAESNTVKTKLNYTFIWDEGGNNVKLIGSFSNWKQKYDMEKDEKEQIYKISIPLNNEKYQYKFIVDGVWKCSKKQNTIDDGKGNINNELDLTKAKPKEEKKKKNPSKKKSKKDNKKKKEKKKENEKKEKKEKKKDDLNIKMEKKKIINSKEFSNEYPEHMNLTEPNHEDNIGQVFNISNESKQKKIGNIKYYKFESNNSYSSNKSYINISNYRHTILNHIVFQETIKKNIYIKIGISYRYREKATTFIYYNSPLKKKN